MSPLQKKMLDSKPKQEFKKKRFQNPQTYYLNNRKFGTSQMYSQQNCWWKN